MDFNANLLHWLHYFFDEKSSDSNTSGGVVKSEITQNEKLAEKRKAKCMLIF